MSSDATDGLLSQQQTSNARRSSHDVSSSSSSSSSSSASGFHSQNVHLPQTMTLQLPSDPKSSHPHHPYQKPVLSSMATHLHDLEQQHQFQVENAALVEDFRNERKTWHSCCFRMDRCAAMHFSQLFFSFVILAFCITQLVREGTSSSSSSTYFALIGVTCGYQLGIHSAHIGTQ